MRSLHKALATSVAAVLLLAVSMGQTNPPAPRSVIAVININKVFASLNEKIDGDAAMETMQNQYKNDQQKLSQKLEKDAGGLRETMFNPDSDEYRKQQDQVLQEKAEYEANGAVAQQKLMLEQRLKTIQIYRRMNDAIKQYAEANGIGLVLVADDVTFDQAMSIDGVQQHIANRKVIYFHPDFDITQKVIEKMNADYKLGNK